MSAMTNLAALFPPEGISIWNPSLPWQPIPVHTVPVSEDQVSFLGKQRFHLLWKKEGRLLRTCYSGYSQIWEFGHFVGCAALILS